MKKVNLVLFVLLASNVFVKPVDSRNFNANADNRVPDEFVQASRNWCTSLDIEGATVLKVAAVAAGGAMLYYHGYLDGKIEILTHLLNSSKISNSKIAWANYEGDKKQDFEDKVNSLFEKYDNKNGFDNAKECKRILSQLDKIFDELGIKRDK